MPALISGIVTDDNGQPVAAARVAFTSGPVPVPDIALMTDRSGAFTISAGVAGTYEVTVVADGFLPRTITIHASTYETSHAVVELRRA